MAATYSLADIDFVVPMTKWLLNFTTARKSCNILLTYLKAFFVRHSSEYETSGSDRKVNPNI